MALFQSFRRSSFESSEQRPITAERWSRNIKKHLPISEHHRAPALTKWAQVRFCRCVEDCCSTVEGVEATLCFIGLAWSCSEMLLIVRQRCGRTFASWQLDGAAVDASLQSIYLPFWHAILCGISKSMSFSQAKYLWSEVMSLIFPDISRSQEM